MTARDTTVYVGNLPHDFREREVDDLFYKYGRIRSVSLKRGYAFVEFDRPREADDAIYYLDGFRVDGAPISVERVRGTRRDKTSGCFVCGEEGHWARNCTKDRGGARAEPAADDRPAEREERRDRSPAARDRSPPRERSPRARSPQ